MKTIFTLLFFCSVAAAQTTQVVPLTSTGTTGGSTFLGPLANTARTYQLLINASQLTGLVGKQLKGFTYRLGPAASTAWPATDITYNSYDVYLSGSVAPVQRSLTFANNVVGTQVQVRSGSLNISASSFTVGSSPNTFGSVIPFSTPYLYSGGNLLVEIRHTGTTSSVSVDAVGTAASTGYGTEFSACWTGSYTGTAGTQGNFAVIQFTYDTPLPLVLSSFAAIRRAADVDLQWNTATELGTRHFVVQRSTDGRLYTPLAIVQAAGSSTGARTYQYTDKNITGISTDVVYYRLQMVDVDGSQKLSPTAVVNLNRKTAVVSMYPNPVKDKATLVVMALQTETITYSITTAEGKTVQAGRYMCVSGSNHFTVGTEQLPVGNYYILLKGTYTQRVISFVKQ